MKINKNNARHFASGLAKKHRNLLLYGIIGASGALIDLILYIILFKLGIPPAIATFISVSFGIANNFFLNSKYNFQVTDHIFHRFINFYLTGVFGALLSALLIYSFVSGLNLDPILAKLLTIVPVVVLQFLINKKVTFSTKPIQHSYVIKTNKNLLYFLLFAMVLFSIGIVTSRIGVFPDEDDNILGGILINNGLHPYVDYFSHHAPLAYYLSSIITALSGPNLGLFREIFFVLCFSIQVSIALFIYKKINRISAYFYLAFTVLIGPTIWTNLLLAETLLGFVTLFMLLCVINADWKKHTVRYLAILAICLGLTGLLNPIYLMIPGILILYSLVVNRRLLTNSLERTWLRYGVAVFSLLLVIAYLFIQTAYFKAFYQDYIIFNSVFYAPFNGDGASYTQLLLTPIRFLKTLLSIHWSADQIFSINGAIMVGWIITLIYLVKQQRYAFSIVLLIIASYTQIRGWNYLVEFNTGGQHAILWRYLGISLIAVYSPLLFKSSSKTNDYWKFVSYSLVSFALLITSLYAASSLLHNYQTIKIGKQDTVINNRSFLTEFNHNVARIGPGTKVWAGPFRFEAYFNRPNSSASNYYFFLPWQAKCSYCTTDLLGDLKRERPEVIVWDSELVVWGYKAELYAPSINEYIVNNYVHSDKPALKSYYFINESIMKRVEKE